MKPVEITYEGWEGGGGRIREEVTLIKAHLSTYVNVTMETPPCTTHTC
jgi:hypothetical protein